MNNLLESVSNLLQSLKRVDYESLAIEYALQETEKALERWEKLPGLIDEIIKESDCFEHHAQSYIWQKIAQMRGVKLSILDNNDIQFIERRISIDLLSKIVEWIKESVR